MASLLTPATLTQLRAYVRNLALERAGDTGLVTDTELNDLINIASRMIWLRIATKYPDSFAQRSAANVVVPASCIVPFSAISAGANILTILNAYAGATGSAESAMSMINTFDRVSDRHVYEPTIPAPALPYRYYVEGTNVVFTPITVGTFDARFAWTQMPLDMTADADQCWTGLQPMYHDVVAFLATEMTVNKDAPANHANIFQYLDGMLAERFGQPLNYLNQGGYAQNPYAVKPKEGRP